MDTLVAKIKEISEICCVEKEYNWGIPPLPESVGHLVSTLASKESVFQKNVYLKENLKDTLKKDESLETHYWIIQKWGGIRTFKKNTKNNNLIKNLRTELNNERLSFDCIASLSKVASFMAPENYAIYDARAIYTLNWLLYKFADGKKLFPQPAGRNAKLGQHDMETIFNLTGKMPEYYSKKEAFHEYCKLMKKLTSMQYGDKRQPYFLEMLLFMIAPTWVISDIKNSVSLTITRDT